MVKAYAVLTAISGQPGLVMEAAESSFADWMRLARLPSSPTPAANEMWLRLGQILHGLTYLHAKCILHCDLKEFNVLCFPQGRMALADLGISRWLTEDSVICRRNEVYTLDCRPVEALHARASKAGAVSSFFLCNFSAKTLHMLFPGLRGPTTTKNFSGSQGLFRS